MSREVIEGSVDLEKEAGLVKIARSVLVAPVPVSQFLKELSSGVPISGLQFSEITLIQKSNKSVPSAGLVMPVGGMVSEEESLATGALREISEEVTMKTFHNSPIQPQLDQNNDSFTYLAPGYKRARATTIFVVPAQSRSFSMHRPREESDGAETQDKIARVVRFTQEELSRFVRNGSLEREGEILRAAGSFTMADGDPITISEADKIKRNAVLENVLSGVNEFDKTLREGTLAAINRVRRIKRIPQAYNISECARSEIATGYVGAQLYMTLSEEAKKEEEQGPHKKMSLLMAIPYFASALPASELPDLLQSVPNMEGLQAATQFERAFSKGADVILSHLSEKGDEHVLLQKEPSFKEVIDIWPQVLQLPLNERVELIQSAENAVMGEIMGSTGAKPEDVAEALRIVENFHDFISVEIKNVVPNVFQEYRPMNELSNSLIFTRLIYALGLHPNLPIDDKGEIELRTLRLEALKELAVFNVALEASREVREADNSVFKGALDTFFNFPPKVELADLGEGRLHHVYHRTANVQIDGRNIHVLVDERQKKTAISATRKRFLSPVVNDIFSINFALADDNFTDSQDPIRQRIETAKQFRDNLVDHIAKETGSFWKVKIMDGTHVTKVIESVSQSGSREETTEPTDEIRAGKRAGSNGDAIVREKFILHLESDDGKIQKIEVNIFPFESTKTESVSGLCEKGYWGFAEKILDDYTGTYKGERIIERDPKAPTRSSLYGLLYPSRFYKQQALGMREKQVTSRKSRIKVGSVD